MDRDEAEILLNKHVKNRNLKKHMLAVESAMVAYAKKFKKDESWWGLVGLLHDIDYEEYSNPIDHPFKGAEILKVNGFAEEFIKTVLAHAAHSGEPRNTSAKKAIFAVDEITGFIVAVALVKPNKTLSEVDVKSVLKKLKDKAFARQVNRNEIYQGAAELGMDLPDHIQIVLSAMQGIALQLGL